MTSPHNITTDLPNEEWRAIPNYEGLYEISNHRRLRWAQPPSTLEYTIASGVIRKNGDIYYTLQKKAQRKRIYASTLVEVAFSMPKPETPHPIISRRSGQVIYGKCGVATCLFIGTLIQGFCGKHYVYNWKYGYPEVPDPVIQALPITNVQAAWLAALIDGEGCIGIYAHHSCRSFMGRVTVANTCKELLTHALAITSVGNIHERQRRKPYKRIYRSLSQKPSKPNLS